jgi:hypothetical protein
MPKENNLLSYAQAHNFTYLALYDMEKVFDPVINSFNGVNLRQNLSAFIGKAKSTYGIVEIGAVGSFSMPNKIFNYDYGYDPSVICTFASSDPTKPLPMLRQRSTEKWSPVVDYINFFSNVYNFNLEFGKTEYGGRIYHTTIDVMSIEWEFWSRATQQERIEALLEWKIIAANIQCIDVVANPHIIIETEMGLIDGTNTRYAPDFTDQQVTDIVVNASDRILLATYVSAAWQLEPWEETSLDLYDNNAKATTFCPLFSAEDPSFTCNPYQCPVPPCACSWNAYLGNWLRSNSLSAAESQYNTDYTGTTTQNNKYFFMYFTYSNLNDNGGAPINRFAEKLNSSNDLCIDKLFGSPSDKSITLGIILPENCSECFLELKNMSGSIVSRTKLFGKGYLQYDMDISILQDGIYFCQLNSDSKKSESKKIIVIH